MNDTLCPDSLPEPESFPGSWDNAARWDLYYAGDDISEQDVYRNPAYLLLTLKRFGMTAPQRILDAGCGISLLPGLAVAFGHYVTAVDISGVAIESQRKRNAGPENLLQTFAAQYHRKYYRNGTMEYLDKFTRDVIDVKGEFEKHCRPGGVMEALEVMDYNSPGMLPRFETFDIILNQNGLRDASPELAGRSFHSFSHLLKPGGILIEVNTNALDSIEKLSHAAEMAGFTLIEEVSLYGFGNSPLPLCRPEQKYAILFWPTG